MKCNNANRRVLSLQEFVEKKEIAQYSNDEQKVILGNSFVHKCRKSNSINVHSEYLIGQSS